MPGASTRERLPSFLRVLLLVCMLGACRAGDGGAAMSTVGTGERVRGVLTEVHYPPEASGPRRVPATSIRLRDEQGREWQFAVATGSDPDAAHLLYHLETGLPVTVEYHVAAGDARIATRITD